MDCSQVREELPGLLYGELGPELADRLREHLAGCAACRREYEALQQVGPALDVVGAPDVEIDLSRLYRDAADFQQRRLRQWRQAAVGSLLAAAAVVVLAVGVRMEVRVEPHQVVFRWGAPPAAPEQSSPSPDHDATAPSQSNRDMQLPAETEERLRLLNELVLALAKDVEARDHRQQQTLAGIQRRIADLQQQGNRRWHSAERDVAALYLAQFGLPKKGETQ